MGGIRQYMITKNFQGPIPILSFPHKTVRWDLPRCANHRLQNPIEGLKKLPVSYSFFFFIGELKGLDKFIAVKAHYDLVPYHGNREVTQPEGLKLRSSQGIVLDVPAFENDTVLRKKLFRAAAGKSTGAEVNFDRLHHIIPSGVFGIFAWEQSLPRSHRGLEI